MENTSLNRYVDHFPLLLGELEHFLFLISQTDNFGEYVFCFSLF